VAIRIGHIRGRTLCNGKLSQRGSGALVLGSPLGAGEIISTGTLTLAMPVSARETWSAKVTGIPLEEIALCFE